MVKSLTDREKKRIAEQARRASLKASKNISQKSTSGGSSSSGSVYNNAARKSARQAETGRTTSKSGGSSVRGSGFEPDSVARSGKTRLQLYEELDRKAGSALDKYDTNDGKRDLLDRIGNLTSRARERKHINNVGKEAQYEKAFMGLQRRNDLDQLAAAGRQRLRNGVFDLTSMTGKSAEEQGVVGETRDDAFHQNAYDFMTPEQRSIYEAFIGLGDRKSAKRYLASIEEGLQQQAADKLLQTIQPGNIENVQDFADVTRLGVRSGIGRFETGVQQLVNPNAVSKNYTEMAFEEARKDMSGATGVVADLANTVGFMLLPAGGSMVLGLAGGAGLAGSAGVKALSASLFGAASGGSTYNDMLKENPGADKFDAKVYSVINGALEGSLQYLLGGIGKLGVGGLSKVTGKTISGAVAKKLSNVAKASANTPAVKGLIKALVGGGKWTAGASDEALEEWLQAVLDPVMRNYVLGENNEVQLFGEDQLYAAFLGALGATVMNAPSNVGSFANAEQILNETVAKQEAKAAARANKNQPANAEAQAIPEATKEQIEAHMDNPDVKDLVIQINRLEAGIATGKSRHNDSPTGRKAQLAKAKKDLATLIAKLEQQQAPEQAPEQAPVDNAAGIPGPPPAPVGRNRLTSDEINQEIARLDDEYTPVETEQTVLGEKNRVEFKTPKISGKEGLDFIRNSVYNNRWQGMIEEQNAENYRNNPGINLIINGVKQLNSSLTDEQAIQVAQELQTESIERGGFGENGVDANSVVDILLEMANEAEETGEPLSPGLQLVVDGIQNKQEEEAILRAEAEARAAIDGSGLITNAVNPVPTNNTTIPQRRGLSPAQQRTNNQQQQQANPRFLPPMPRLEDQQQPAEATAETQPPVNEGFDLIARGLSIAPYMEASQANRQRIMEGVTRNSAPAQQQTETTAAEDLQDAIEKAKDEQLSSEEIQSIIDKQLAEGDQTARQALSDANARAEQAVPAEIYRRAMAYLKYQQQYLSPEEYNSRVQQVEGAYRSSAAAAGVTDADIEAVLNGSAEETRYSINHNSKTTEDEQVDRLIDALIERLQGRGNLDSFERTAMAEDVAGSQTGRSISVNENLRGTAEEANAVAHETGHLAARIDSKLAPDILEIMRGEGYDVESMVEERRNAYREDFERLGIAFDENKNDTAFFEEEVAMGFIGDICENNPELLNKIATEQPSLIQRILDALRKIIDTLTGRERDACEVTIERLNSALNRSSNNAVDNSETRHLFGGKNALKASKSRYDMALKMFRADESADSIWQKTGWLLGPDGHWRFEIDDSKMKFDPNGKADFYANNRNSRLDELNQRLMDPETGELGLSDEELDEYNQLRHDRQLALFSWTASRERNGDKGAYLSDWIEHDELFKNYPDLKRVGFKWDYLPPGEYGNYDPLNDTITISESLRFAPESTVLHEIQHAIQEREDFASGASPEYWQNKINKGENPRRSLQWQDDYLEAVFHRLELDDKYPGIREDFYELEEIMRPAIDDDLPELSPDEQLATEIRWQNKRNELIDKYGEAVVNDYELTTMRAEPENPKHFNPFVLYENTAGEQESREVQNRLRMTRSQRKFNTPNIGGYDTVFTDNSSVHDPNYYYQGDDYDEKNPYLQERYWGGEYGRRTEYGREQDESEIATDYGARPEGPVQGLSGPAVSEDYSGREGGRNGGRRNPELARGVLALERRGKSFTDLENTQDPEYFHSCIGEAKQANPYGAFVEQKEVEKYSEMTLLTDSTGTTGAAVTKSGDIVSVFKDPHSPVKGAMTSILFSAIANGGKKLDNFNSSVLSNMYAQHGFVPVARTAFDDEFAPGDWNYERDGRPDIVFWVHNGDSLETIANKIGTYERPDYDSLPMFGDYGQAEAYRDSLIAEKGNEDITRYSIKRLNLTTKEENLDKLVPENKKALEPLKNHRYKPESMDETTAKAWGWIEKHGGTNDDITEPYTSLMNKKGEWKPTEMEAALVMFGSLAQNGDENSASALAAKIIGQAPDFGRVINYFKILQRYMPNAVSSISRSIADQIDVELTDAEKDNIDLCDRIAKQGFISDSVKTAATPEFREWLEEASEYVDRGQLDATTAAYAAAMSLVTAKQPSTARQKFRALQRISLLSNPKTHFRNILGNVAEQAGSVMSRPGADLADRFISKFTNQRTFGSGGAEAFAKAVTDSVEKAVMDHALGINTVGNKFDEDTINRSGLLQLARQNAFDEKTHKALRNGISRVANNIDHLIGLGLSIGDAPFLIGTYEAALTQIMNANNATEATEEMMDTAWDVAFRRTFRDNNAVTKALTGIRNSLPFIGETIAPYVQTPVNVVLTAIQYSPIGVGEAFFKAFVDLGGSTSLRTQLKNNESTMKTQRQIAELVGRGALGTAAMLVGALLASAGRITGDDDDIDSQKEKNWNTATGRKGSSIKVGDTYIDPSSLQSLSTPIMAGAAAYEGKEEGDGIDWAGILGAAVKASMKMGNTMLEMPVLQGVADLFSGNYDNGELLAGALSLAGNAATQVVPFGSLLKQAGKAVDPYSRVQSEINAGPGERVLKSTVNNLKTMLPGTRKTLSQRYDVLGNPIKNDASDNVAERLYNSFINPFNTSKENTNEVTDEIDRLYAALQDTDVLPSAAGNSISYGGEKYKFTSAEKQEYQRVEGESNAEILSSLVNSEAYDQLTDEEKAKVLSSIYDYSSNKAKADYLKKQGVEYESDAKWMDSIDSIVETGVDIGSAMVYRYELNQIDGADEQAKYIMSLPISADQKKAFDTQFVDKFGFHPITDDRDYTSEDTLALSMTSDSGRGKYDRVFSGDWTAPSGNSYRSLSGVEFGELYDACYFKSSPTKAESIESIRNMLMEKWGLDDYSATTLATDFRAVMGSKKY